ncbi:DUF3833 family protein [Sphingomonas sabuli]|uniref:DUF3833 family protein n=1 Tax=Sphingomonas sabuli TaxID=2764186 RepID=A0A7G9KZD9_9SPHN|nr:DUF3833 family protein [Sphingomonas sabuli]QNM81738.1 DUF3833 family protein [Sphingomonas sabuli]
MSLSRCIALGASAVAVFSLPVHATSSSSEDPLKFFEGRTESVSTVKIMLKKPYKTRAMGTGKIRGDGTLELVQRVERSGEPTKVRRWTIRPTGPGRYTGTMTEAVGPVHIEKVGNRYHFKFKMKGNLSVDQWMAPNASWTSADNDVSIRRLGLKVASAEGYIRRLD